MLVYGAGSTLVDAKPAQAGQPSNQSQIRTGAISATLGVLGIARICLYSTYHPPIQLCRVTATNISRQWRPEVLPSDANRRLPVQLIFLVQGVASPQSSSIQPRIISSSTLKSLNLGDGVGAGVAYRVVIRGIIRGRIKDYKLFSSSLSLFRDSSSASGRGLKTPVTLINLIDKAIKNNNIINPR